MAETEIPQAELTIEPGDLIAGKYRVEEHIGSGGMGIVVSARHVAMGNRLAIKILRLKEERDPHGAITRFVREARAAARIQSDHVVRVTDVAALPDGTPYMVMEYLDGEDLRAVLEMREGLPVEDAVGYILQACEGLAEAHASGVIHRDLKPSNLFLARKSNGTTVLKILDFGISKVMPRGGEAGITTTGALMGSPLYMAPEQMRSSKDVDARADVWSLGLILYELLAGVSPFEGESVPEVCLAVMGAEPMPLNRVRTDVPPDLEWVVFKCLSKKREERYASMGDLARALEPFAAASSRVHAERASIAAKTVRSEGPPPMDVDVRPIVRSARGARGTKGVGSTPDRTEAPLRRAPESIPSWSAGRAGARRSKVWIAIGVAACAVAVLVGSVVARGPSAAPASKSGATGPSASSSSVSPPTTTADMPSVPVDSLPVVSYESVSPPATGSSVHKLPPPVPHGPASARPAHPATPPASAASSAAQKDGWKWGDRN